MPTVREISRTALLRRGVVLEAVTLGWYALGVVALAMAALTARSVALAGLGLDSLLEVGASTVVLWELTGTGKARQRLALRLVGAGFALLALYLPVQAGLVLAVRFHPHHSPLGIAWSAATVAVLGLLAVGKARTGRALDNPVLRAEGRATLVGALPAAAVLVGLLLNGALGWWWADPVAGCLVAGYAVAEVVAAVRGTR
ncbi:cation transporter [Kitasatospora sp. LaBMicrA B282]|uniref:cation transporter n=1 Tax=Kitasatospora sp. LaBMicrA B282 TaxID=3420949 RepID=UPI003D0B0A39